MRGLVEQEQAAKQQDQIAAADAHAGNLEQVGRQAHDPTEGEQQRQPRDHGKTQPDAAGFVAHLGRQAPHKDGDENDVVDAQDDFQGGQHRKSDPDIGVEQKFHEDGGPQFGAKKCGR